MVDEKSIIRTKGDEGMCTFGKGECLVEGNVGVGVDDLQQQRRISVR